jgi:hypothetical protein
MFMKNSLMKNLAIGSGLLSLTLGVASSQAAGAGWLTVSSADPCVTEGTIDKAAGDRLSVNVPKMCAYITAWTAQSIEARFTHLGPTPKEAALG